MAETEKKHTLTLTAVAKYLSDMLEMIKDVEKAEPQDQWYVVYYVNRIIYNTVVINTCIELLNWNKLHTILPTSNFTSQDWLNIQKNYIESFLNECNRYLGG